MDGASLNFNNTNNININAGEINDPKKLTAMLGDEIENRSIKVFKNFHEKDIPLQSDIFVG